MCFILLNFEIRHILIYNRVSTNSPLHKRVSPSYSCFYYSFTCCSCCQPEELNTIHENDLPIHIKPHVGLFLKSKILDQGIPISHIIPRIHNFSPYKGCSFLIKIVMIGKRDICWSLSILASLFES